MPQLKLSLLGPPRLTVNETQINLPRRKLLALLVYLALTRQPQRRDALATLFWGETGQKSARASLRRELYALNNALGDGWLAITRQEIGINVAADIWMDVAAFREHLATSGRHDHAGEMLCDECIAALTAATELYQGHFLAGFTLSDAPDFDDWQFFEAEGLRRNFADTLQKLIGVYAERETYDASIDYARQWLQLDAMHEPAHRTLMHLFALAGQQAAAVRQYDECVRILDEELGVPPEEETTQLYEAIRTRRYPNKRDDVEAAGQNLPQTTPPTQAPPVQAGEATIPQPARYVIDSLLATGGHGNVYRGHDTTTGVTVVIKRLQPEVLQRHPEFVERFQREAEVLRRLDHPNIVKLLATYEHEGQRNVIMEYVPGGSLRDRLTAASPLSIAEALGIGLELADALSHSHHKGVLHRDLKPANVLLAADGTPRLTDFGIARLLRDDVRLTQARMLLGSPAYASPEMLNDEELDARSDIWAFGILLYEMLAGKPPFVGKSLTAVLTGIMSKPVPPITAIRTDTPPTMVDLLQQLLAKDRNQRIDSMRQVAADLEAIRNGKTTPVYASPLPLPQSDLTVSPQLPALPHDWGDAPEASTFYGRQSELAQLQEWLVVDRCRLVAVLGMGGMGKTSLAVKVVQKLTDPIVDANAASSRGGTQKQNTPFVCIIWRSLLNAPPLMELLQQWLQFLSGQQVTELPTNVDHNLTLLLTYLRQHRCLLVLDNVESILQGNEEGEHDLPAGRYRPGYEAYGQLFRRLAESRHQSCLLLTSRERPQGLRRMEGDTPLVQSLHLTGLSQMVGQQFLADRGLATADSLTEQLVTRYSGNPLALKLITDTIQDLFAGDIALFLADETLIFDDIRAILDQQVARLSALEREILIWLMIEREAITAKELLTNLAQPPTRRLFLEALRSLERRSLLVKSNRDREVKFLLQNVVTEYINDRLIEQIGRELESEELSDFTHHALMKAQAKDYIRESQARLILQPIAQQLVNRYGQAGAETKLRSVLTTLQADDIPLRPSYAAGNILNLLLTLGSDLRGTDFSGLTVWQANLGKVHLPEVNFAQADLTGTSFLDTFPPISSVTFSPDGTLIAAGTNDGQIRLWRVTDGQPVMQLEEHSRVVRAVAFSNDGRTLASGSDDRSARLWDVASGREINQLAVDTGIVRSTAFNHAADGDLQTVAMGSIDQTVQLWDLQSGEKLQTVRGHSKTVLAIAFSPKAARQPQLMASGSADHTIRLWDVQSGDCRQVLTGHTAAVRAVVFSPDGMTLASGGDDQTIRLWDLQSGTCYRTLVGHANSILSLIFRSASTGFSGHADLDRKHGETDVTLLASGSADETIRLWNVESGTCLNTLTGHTNWVWAVAFSPDGTRLVSSNDDQTVRLWDVGSGNCLKTLTGYTNSVRVVAFRPMTNNASGQTTTMLTEEQRAHQLAAGCEDGSVRLWHVGVSNQQVNTLVGHSHIVTAVAFSPNGQILATGSIDLTIRLWDLQTGKCLNILTGHTDHVRSVCYSPNGQLLASTSVGNAIYLWDVTDPAKFEMPHTTLVGHTSSVLSAAFSPDGQTLVSGSVDKTIRVWDVAIGECRQILSGHTNQVNCVAFAPEGQTVASGSADQTVKLWDLQSGSCRQTLSGHSNWIRSVAFCTGSMPSLPDKERESSWKESETGRSSSARLTPSRKMPDSKSTPTMIDEEAHRQRIQPPTPAAPMQLLASCSDDQTVCLWDVEQGVCLTTLTGHSSAVMSVDFSPLLPGHPPLLASGSADKTIKLWDLQNATYLATLPIERPYERMNITGVTGLTAAQQATLQVLGAIDDHGIVHIP